MKKLLALLLAAVLVVGSLTGCNKSNTGDAGSDASGDVEQAKAYLMSMYEKSPEVTASDYDVVSIVMVDGVKYNVTWTADAADVKIVPGDKMTKIDVNEESANDVSYVLTATIADPDGKTATATFNHKVPAYKVTSWTEYAAAAAGDNLVCKGIVTGIMSKKNGNSSNCLYFQDEVGGYYAYNLGTDPLEQGIKVGMTVQVTGTKDIYSGTHEIANGVAVILDEGTSVPAPVDYTDAYINAADLKDASITEKQALLVTLKNVEITGQDVAGGYFKFKLGDKESYIRISSSVCPIVTEKDAFIAGHTEHTGWLADATGVICVYDGAFYLTPVTVDGFVYNNLPQKSDKEKVEFEAANVSIPGRFTEAGEAELPAKGTTFDDVAIAWATDNEAVAAVADGKLAITLPNADTTVTVTGTFTCGSETFEQAYEIKVEAPADDLSVAETLAKAFALGEGEAMTGVQVLRGEIVEIPTAYNPEYGNVTVNIQVGEQIIQCFRLIGGEELVVGDVITVTGNLKNYKGTVEFDAKCTYSKDLSIEEAKQEVVLAKAFELGEGEAMTGTQILRGEIVEIPTAYNPEYGNVTVNIKVGEQIVQCFRLIGGEELVVGDVITVTGNIKNYKGTVEFDAKCTYVKDQSLEDAKAALVLKKAFELAEGEAMNGLQTVTGTITEIPTAYNAEYGNVTVNIQVGEYVVQCFRLIGGEELVVGDVITVTGYLKNYKGTVEFDAKCTYEK